MITAVDTNVLLDVLGGDADFGPRSANALRRCIREGTLVACDIVWAETAAALPAESPGSTLLELGVSFSALSRASAELAGDRWKAYRASGGPRTRVIADFLIGAHGSTQADRLLTRDRGFYRTQFTELSIIDPLGGLTSSRRPGRTSDLQDGHRSAR